MDNLLTATMLMAKITSELHRSDSLTEPFGFKGDVEHLTLLSNDLAAAVVKGSVNYAKPEKRLCYRIEIRPNGTYRVKAFAELMEDEECLDVTSWAYMMRAEYPYVTYFEEWIKKYRMSECTQLKFKEFRMKTITYMDEAIVYLYEAGAEAESEGSCQYHLKRNEDSCWSISEWKCPNCDKYTQNG